MAGIPSYVLWAVAYLLSFVAGWSIGGWLCSRSTPAVPKPTAAWPTPSPRDEALTELEDAIRHCSYSRVQALLVCRWDALRVDDRSRVRAWLSSRGYKVDLPEPATLEPAPVVRLADYRGQS